MQLLLKKIETFKSFLQSFHDIQMNYYLSLKNLTDHYANIFIFSSNNKVEPSMCQIFSLLSNICKNIKETIKEFNSKIIETSNVYIKMIDNSNLILSIEENQKSLEITEKNINNAQKVYNEHMKMVEKFAIETQLDDTIMNNKSLQKIVKIAKEKEQIYKDNIKSYDNQISNFNKQIKSFLINYNGFLIFEREQYQKSINLYLNSLKTIISFTESTIPSLSSIPHKNTSLDELKFPTYKTILFEEYSPNLINTVSIPDFQKQTILSFIQTHFKIKSDHNILSSPNENDFIHYVKQIILPPPSENDLISIKDCEILIKKYLVNNIFREKFIYYLNAKRGKDNSIYPEEKYFALLKICNFLFEVMSVQTEFESLKHLLLLSQSFYYNSTEDKNKIFIEDGLKMNTKLTTEKFWIDFIEKEIQYEKDNNQSQVFITVIVNIANFAGFIQDKNKVLNVINHFYEAYKFTEQEKESIQREVDENLSRIKVKNNIK